VARPSPPPWPTSPGKGEQVLVVGQDGASPPAASRHRLPASCATTTSSRRWSELNGPRAWRSGSPTPRRSPYHGSGYIAPRRRPPSSDDLTTVHERQQQNRIPVTSSYSGEARGSRAQHAARSSTTGRAPGLSVCPARGGRAGFAYNPRLRCSALASKAAWRRGRRSREGRRGHRGSSLDAVGARSRACRPRPGRSRSDRSSVGRWGAVDHGAVGRCSACRRAWRSRAKSARCGTYWYLQEGRGSTSTRRCFVTNDGSVASGW